jgi:hypothetical protein
MTSFHILNSQSRALVKDWRRRVSVDDSLLTADNFKALLDFITEKDDHWQSLQQPVDMKDINK